ncbi:MAG: glycogen debranching protein [Synechococcales cyanobacterium RU_4_20]|nr:glycogen debranching protein [Synechococcales cyanobacterium RU_4_20]NJR67876.1 glycogen debranching protein [Synechococcales cyanobacterium CRU_2_2]
MQTIWVTEQFDGAGILYSCIACCDAAQAQDCYESFEEKLKPEQRQQGWVTRQRQVSSWDEVPVAALKLSH